MYKFRIKEKVLSLGTNCMVQYPTDKIHIHTELSTNPLTSHQFSQKIARRMMMRSQHYHAI